MDGTLETPPVAAEILQQPTPPPHDSQEPGSTEVSPNYQHNHKRMDLDEDTSGPDMMSPMSAEGDKHDEAELPALTNSHMGSPSLGYDFSNIRVGIYQLG